MPMPTLVVTFTSCVRKFFAPWSPLKRLSNNSDLPWLRSISVPDFDSSLSECTHLLSPLATLYLTLNFDVDRRRQGKNTFGQVQNRPPKPPLARPVIEWKVQSKALRRNSSPVGTAMRTRPEGKAAAGCDEQKIESEDATYGDSEEAGDWRERDLAFRVRASNPTWRQVGIQALGCRSVLEVGRLPTGSVTQHLKEKCLC